MPFSSCHLWCVNLRRPLNKFSGFESVLNLLIKLIVVFEVFQAKEEAILILFVHTHGSHHFPELLEFGKRMQQESKADTHDHLAIIE